MQVIHSKTLKTFALLNLFFPSVAMNKRGADSGESFF